MTNEKQTLLTAKQVGQAYGIATSTLAKMRLSGGGPVFVKLGRRVLYRQDDLNNWVSENRFRSTSEYDAAED